MTPREAAEQVVALWDEQLTVPRGHDDELLLIDGNTTVGSEWGWRIEGESVTNEERANILLSTTDAAIWTDQFMAVIDGGATVDWGLMVGWFANAIETGRRVGHEQGYVAGMTAAAEALT